MGAIDAEREELFRFALDAMTWIRQPTERSRSELIAAARTTADHTGVPERFEEFATWLEARQPTVSQQDPATHDPTDENSRSTQPHDQ